MPYRYSVKQLELLKKRNIIMRNYNNELIKKISGMSEHDFSCFNTIQNIHFISYLLCEFIYNNKLFGSNEIWLKYQDNYMAIEKELRELKTPNF